MEKEKSNDEMLQEKLIQRIKSFYGFSEIPNDIGELRSPYALNNVPSINEKPVFDDDKVEQAYQSIRLIRNLIIESALLVESELITAILHFIAGTDYPKHKVLRHLVFEAEFCTFMQKRKILSQIFEIHDKKITCFTLEEAKSLRREINEIILERDKFAHGRIIIDCEKYQPMIRYYRNGEKMDEIQPEYGQEFVKRCNRCIIFLSKLIQFLKNNHLE